MLSSEGENLGAAELTPAGEGTFLTSVIVPARRFRVAVVAGDTAGRRVQRVYAPLFMVASQRSRDTRRWQVNLWCDTWLAFSPPFGPGSPVCVGPPQNGRA